MDLQLQNKVVLISGGSGGIGWHTAVSFAREKCHIGLCGRNVEDLRRAEAELRGQGNKVVAVQADVCKPTDAARFVDQCVFQLGGIDILVNNVGGSSGGRKVMETTDAHWQETFEVSLFQAVRLTRLAVPYMQGPGGGAIINVASISGWSPQLAGSAQYGCAKAALSFLAERLALELSGAKIRVNTVSPGSIGNTGSWRQFEQQHPESLERYVQEGFPMGRLGTPEEVADVIVFLASPRASWINGRHIAVDGLEQPIGIREHRPW